MSGQAEWMTATEARELLGVSRGKFAQLVKDGKWERRDNALDRRIKMVRRAVVEALLSEQRPKARVAAA